MILAHESSGLSELSEREGQRHNVSSSGNSDSAALYSFANRSIYYENVYTVDDAVLWSWTCNGPLAYK